MKSKLGISLFKYKRCSSASGLLESYSFERIIAAAESSNSPLPANTKANPLRAEAKSSSLLAYSKADS